MINIALVAALTLESFSDVEWRGTLRFKDVEGGVWVLETGRRSYDLHGKLGGFKDGQRVLVTGRIARDRACIHMIGPVIQVESIRLAQKLR